MRFRNFFAALRYTLALLAVFLIGLTVTLFIVFPRAVNWLADLLGPGAENPVHWVPAIIIDLILIFLAIVWVWLPWQQYRVAQKAQGLVVRRGQGRAYIDAESVRQQIYAAVSKIPAIQRTEVSVANELGRAAVSLNLLTDNAINGPKKKQEISREVKKVVEDQLGVQLASDPTINMSLTPIPEIVAVAPQVATAPASPRATVAPTSRPIAPVPTTTPKPVPAVIAEPPPEPPQAEPASKLVKDTEPVSTVIVNQEAPKNPLEAAPQTMTETDQGSMPATPRPFVRRPFTPPSGSSTLPDLPPIPPRKELPADTPTANPAELKDESQPASDIANSNVATDDNQQDESAPDESAPNA